MNKQRDVIYKRRKNALFGDHLRYDITNSIYDAKLQVSFLPLNGATNSKNLS